MTTPPERIRLPPLAVGERRGMLRRLLAASVTYATAAVTAALMIGALAGATKVEAIPVLVLAGSVAVMAGARYLETVTAESLGQNYVHELRIRIVSAAITGPSSPSLGITIARATNDLAGVRGWVAQGLAPALAAIPLLIGSIGVLLVVHWALAIAVVIPMIGLSAVLVPASRVALRRARLVRRLRGRLAARVSDTLQATEAVISGGGLAREIGRIDGDSQGVVEASIARARVAGLMQGTSVAVSVAIAGLVVLVGRAATLEPGAVAVGLTVSGVLSAPLAGAGRLVELRQNYEAARRIIAPQIAAHAALSSSSKPLRPRRHAYGTGLIVIGPGSGSDASTAPSVPQLVARNGDRVLVTASSAARASTFLRSLAVPDRDLVSVLIDGWEQAALKPRRQRELVGLAFHGMRLERGTLARCLRYRRPDLPPGEADLLAQALGLDDIARGLARGERTVLKGGGRPLTEPQRALLAVGRAAFGSPPLLILDRVDSELDPAGRTAVRTLLADYRGVVVFTSDDPSRLCTGWSRCDIDDSCSVNATAAP